MFEWKVAPSYQNATIINIDEENRKARIEQTCDRCGGHGIIAARVENGHIIPIPVDGGVCYKCHGKGTITKTVKVYNEKEYAQFIKAKERAKAKREAEAAARNEMKQTLTVEELKHKKALSLGYNEDEKVYIVCGGNTYAVKDKLKALGATYQPILGWHFQNKVEELPQGYLLCEVSFDDVYDYFSSSYRDDAKDIIQQFINEVEGPSPFIYYPAEEKERIRDITVTVSSIHGFDSFYGYTNIYTFTTDLYTFVWMTSKSLDLAIGDSILLTGTIKTHKEYKGVKQTVLSRCIIKEV